MGLALGDGLFWVLLLSRRLPVQNLTATSDVTVCCLIAFG